MERHEVHRFWNFLICPQQRQTYTFGAAFRLLIGKDRTDNVGCIRAYTKVVSCLMICFLHVFGQLCDWTVGFKTESRNHTVQTLSSKILAKGSGARKGERSKKQWNANPQETKRSNDGFGRWRNIQRKNAIDTESNQGRLVYDPENQRLYKHYKGYENETGQPRQQLWEGMTSDPSISFTDFTLLERPGLSFVEFYAPWWPDLNLCCWGEFMLVRRWASLSANHLLHFKTCLSPLLQCKLGSGEPSFVESVLADPASTFSGKQIDLKLSPRWAL